MATLVAGAICALLDSFSRQRGDAGTQSSPLHNKGRKLLEIGSWR